MALRTMLRSLGVLWGMAAIGGLPLAADEVSIQAVVVAVLDGDTLEIHRSGRSHLLDVAEIDCPELEQPFGAEARRRAADLVEGEAVEIGLREMPSGGRLVGSVRLADGRDLTAELLRLGLAWWTGGGQEDGGSPVLRSLERQARAAERGLWSHADPVPPWTFRGESPALAPREPERAAPPDEPPRSSRRQAERDCIPRSQCCRVCVKGKACGNSCINVSFNCHKSRGCSCNSYEVCA